MFFISRFDWYENIYSYADTDTFTGTTLAITTRKAPGIYA